MGTLRHLLILIGGVTVSPTGISIDVEFGSPVFSAVNPTGFDIDVEFGAPTFLQDFIVTPDGFEIDISFGSPAFVIVEPDLPLLIAVGLVDVDIQPEVPVLVAAAALLGTDEQIVDPATERVQDVASEVIWRDNA